MDTTLTETLKQIETNLTGEVEVKAVQGRLYVTTRYTTSKEWAANVVKVRAVAKQAQEQLTSVGRETARDKAVAGGFWNMGRFCKERVTMCVRVKLTESENFAVLCGRNP